ncbi:MAG: thioredoxin family protein [Desulfosudaceae bacterium]
MIGQKIFKPALIGLFLLFSVAGDPVFSNESLENNKVPAPAATAKTVAAASRIQWFDYSKAVDKAAEQDKKIYLYFYADWCSYCKKMSSETFTNENVIKTLNRDFIPVRVKQEDDRELTEKYNVQGFPSSWFLEKTGEKIGAKPGYLPPEPFLELLDFVINEKYKE